MDIALHKSTLSLARDQLVAVRNAKGTRVRCLSGSLWITEGESEVDTILEPGQCFTLSRWGLTLIMALDAASLRLSEPERKPRLPWIDWAFARVSAHDGDGCRGAI